MALDRRDRPDPETGPHSPVDVWQTDVSLSGNERSDIFEIGQHRRLSINPVTVANSEFLIIRFLNDSDELVDRGVAEIEKREGNLFEHEFGSKWDTPRVQVEAQAGGATFDIRIVQL